MKGLLSVLALVLTCYARQGVSIVAPAASDKVFVAYIPSAAVGYSPPCNLNLYTLDVSHFTHLNIPFATFDTVSFILTAQNGDDTNGWYTSVLGLKTRNSNLKVLVSVGGVSFGGAPWDTMLSNTFYQNMFIANAISFARQHSLDGLDINWQYPTAQTQTPQIASFFSAFHTAIINEATTTGRTALLLTVLSPNNQHAISSFNFPAIYQYVDWINVMNYDYYGPWSSGIGANTAFSGSAGLDVVATFSYLAGVPPTKLVMGFANYARTFTLASPSQTVPGSPFIGVGTAGPCTSSAGIYSYYEVLNYRTTHPAGTYVYDSPSRTNYFYYGSQWITYDNLITLQTKTDFITVNGYKGAMLWALDGNNSVTSFVANQLGL